MTNPPKKKGTAFESAVVAHIAAVAVGSLAAGWKEHQREA
jgi:hypothetical protein